MGANILRVSPVKGGLEEETEEEKEKRNEAERKKRGQEEAAMEWVRVSGIRMCRKKYTG